MEQWPGPQSGHSSNDVGEVMEQLQWGCKSLWMLQARVTRLLRFAVGEAGKMSRIPTFQSKLSWTSGKAGRWHDYEWTCRNAKAKSNFLPLFWIVLVLFLKSDLFEAFLRERNINLNLSACRGVSWMGPFFRCARQRPSTAEWELVGTLENGACRGRRSGNSTRRSVLGSVWD